MIARLSQMTWWEPPHEPETALPLEGISEGATTRAGIFPVGETSSIRPFDSGKYIGITVSSKGMSRAVISIQGLSDQDE